MTFADELLKLRSERRMSQTQLAKELGVSYTSVNRQMCIRDRTDADPDKGCMEFEIRKGRFSFRLTAPYSDERRQATSELAKKNGLKGRV